MKFLKTFFKIFFISIFALVFLITLSVSIVSTTFSRSIGQKPTYIIDTVYNSFKNNSYQSKDKINFLLLGLDERNDALEKTETTDTIMFI